MLFSNVSKNLHKQKHRPLYAVQWHHPQFRSSRQNKKAEKIFLSVKKLLFAQNMDTGNVYYIYVKIVVKLQNLWKTPVLYFNKNSNIYICKLPVNLDPHRIPEEQDTHCQQHSSSVWLEVLFSSLISSGHYCYFPQLVPTLSPGWNWRHGWVSIPHFEEVT